MHRLLDVVVISAVLVFSSVFYLDAFTLQYQIALLVVIVTYFLSAEISGLYHTHKLFSFNQVLRATLSSWLLCIVLSPLIGFFLKISEDYSRVVIGVWFLTTPIVLIGWRLASIDAFKFKQRREKKKSIIIGATKAGLSLANELKNNKLLGEEVVGFFDDRPLTRLTESLGIETLPAKKLGNVDDALRMAKNRQIKNVYVALPMEASKRIKQICTSFADSNAHVHFVPDLFSFDLMHSRWKNIGGLFVVSVHDTPFRGMNSFTKRIEDLILSALILILISPVMLFVAIGVKLSSPGPIIFKQDRYGLDGHPIKVWKFRSMRSTDNGAVVKQATKNDPRVTKFGAFIRRTSLDELPQFINVLQGKMSIVGPRPHAVAHNEEYRNKVDKYMLRHHVKPGITGLAQVSGYRGETDTLDKMEKRVEYDLKYIHGWSVWLDIKIIFLTVFKGFVGKTAY